LVRKYPTFWINFLPFKVYSDTIYEKEQEILKNIELLSQYRKVIDESSLVYKLDSNGKIIYVNDNLLELSQYNKKILSVQIIIFYALMR